MLGQVGNGDNLARGQTSLSSGRESPLYVLEVPVLSDGGLQRYKLLCGLGAWEGLACVQHWPDCPLQHWPRDEVVFVQQKAEPYILALRGALW